MGVAYEANPFVAGNPSLAVGAKCALTALLLTPILGRYALRVRAFGALAWGVGAVSNIAVLVATP